MAAVNRTARISEEIKKELSDIIRNGLRDPRLPDMLSILSVDVSRDFAYAKVYYSVLSGQGDEKEIGRALAGAAGYMRRELGSRIKLRQTPELRFELDRSIEQVITMSRLIDQTLKEDAGRAARRSET